MVLKIVERVIQLFLIFSTRRCVHSFFTPPQGLGYGRVRLYAEPDYKHLIMMKSIEPKDGCINIYYGNDRLSSIETNGACVMLYVHFGCTGDFLRVTRNIFSTRFYNFEDNVSSFRACTQKEAVKPDPKPQFSLFNNPHFYDPIYHSYDTCWCLNLPGFARSKVSSLHTYGNCIHLWGALDCQGEMKKFDAGGVHTNLKTFGFDNKAQSVSVCPDSENCVRFYGTVDRIHFKIGGKIAEKLRKSPPSERLELAHEALFINSWTSTVIREYAGSKTIEETYTFRRIPALSKFHSVQVDKNVRVTIGGGNQVESADKEYEPEGTEGKGFGEIFSSFLDNILGKYEADVPFLKEQAFKDQLQYAFPYQAISGSGWSGEWVVKNYKTWGVNETIVIPTRKTYVVRSFVDMAVDLIIPYEMSLIVFGDDHARHMTAEEGKKRFPFDKAAKMGKGSVKGSHFFRVDVTGKLKATFAVRTHVEVDSKSVSIFPAGASIGDVFDKFLKVIKKLLS